MVIMAAILAFSCGAAAQIPNAGFEDWTSIVNRTNPTGWHSVNDWIDSSAAYFPVTMSTDHYPASTGRYSIRLESNPVYAAPVSWAMAGTAAFQSGDRPLFPITGHPDTLCGYYKYLPQGDTLQIHVHLYKNSNEITMGQMLSGNTVSTWTRFTIPISAYADADSARIMLSAICEGPNKTMPVYGNSVLFVDDLSLVASNLSVEKSQIASKPLEVTVTGNGVLNYRLSAAAFVSVRVFDLRGRLLSAGLNERRSSGSYSMPFLSGRLPSGVYLLGFDADNMHVRKSFVVMH
jgi:hypothetical protein